MNQLFLGNATCVSKNWNIGTESEFIKRYESVEGYTTLYGFYNLPEDKKTINTRNEEFLKECNLCFDRLVFDFDNDENPFGAIEQGIALREWFKSEFKDLYSEIWFSGNKGCHVYVYFEPISVDNPKAIYSHILDVLKTKLGFNYLDSSLKNVYAGLIRIKNSKHSKTGYYKANITNAVDAGLIKNMEDIYRIARNSTVSIAKFNHDARFIAFVEELDRTVTLEGPKYDAPNQYITSTATEPLQKALIAIWKPGQRDHVAFPLIHSLYRAGKSEQETKDFFSFLPDSEYNEIVKPKIYATYHNPLTRRVGIPTLKRNWSEVGGDLTAIDEYFTVISEDSVFYPYKPPVVDDSNVKLPDGWKKTHQKGTKFTFEKDDMIIKFKKDFIIVSCEEKEIYNGKFDKRKLSQIAKDNKVSEFELLELKDATTKFISNRENEYTLLMRELNSRLGAGETIRTARTVAKYFHNRKAWNTPKGTVMIGIDNIGRFLSEDDLKKLLYDDFKPSQIITHDYFKYINDLPEITPDYNMLRCNNGFFNFNTGEFKTKSSKPLVILKESPYNYREDLIGTAIPKDLQLLFNNLYNASVKSLLEVIGYCLTDANPLKLIIIFIGDGDSGKTIIMNLTGALLGNNTSSVDIFNIQETNISLITKDLNLISEFRKTDSTGLAKLKNYSGNEAMEFRQIYGKFKLFQAEDISKTIIATNNVNGLTKYTDRSTFNRFKCIIEFKKQYSGKPDTGIENRILSNTDTMDWLLSNSIHAYMMNTNSLESIHTPAEVKKLIEYYDNPITNEILETYEYIPLNEQAIYASGLGYQYMDDREFLIEHGVTVDEIKEFFEKHGELTPKQPIKKLKQIFDDNNIERISKTVNGKPVKYVLGLLRK